MTLRGKVYRAWRGWLAAGLVAALPLMLVGEVPGAAPGTFRPPTLGREFALAELAAVQKQLLAVRAERRERQAELDSLKEKQVEVARLPVPLKLIEEELARSEEGKRFSEREQELRAMRASYQEKTTGGAREAGLALVERRIEALEAEREKARTRVIEQARQKAREAFQAKMTSIQDRVRFLDLFEARLLDEAARLQRQAAPKGGTVEERLAGLEQEVQQLRAAVAELTALLKKK
jgi:hypothetical protein